MGSGRSWCLSQVCLNSKSISFLCATVLTFKPTGELHHSVPGMEESGHRNWEQGSLGE